MQKQIAKNGGSKGITLIALVITIIVLLILAGVTISMVLGDDGIIAQAQGAKTAQDEAEKEEQEEIRKGEGNIDLYTEGTVANKVKVGDYVKYEYTPDDYSTSDTGDVGVAAQGFSSKPDGNAVVTNWRVLSKENGIVKLVSDDSTTGKLKLNGVNGFKKGIDVLDDMCEKLYSSEIGTARSITLDDINEITGYIPETAIATKADGTNVNVPYGITIKEAAELEEIQYDMTNFVTTNIIEPKKEVGDYRITTYTYAVIEKLKNDSEKAAIIMDSKGYWIASQSVVPFFNQNIVGLGLFKNGGAFGMITYNDLCVPDGSLTAEGEAPICPVVVLKTGLKVANEKETITDSSGNTKEAWVIKD